MLSLIRPEDDMYRVFHIHDDKNFYIGGKYTIACHEYKDTDFNYYTLVDSTKDSKTEGYIVGFVAVQDSTHNKSFVGKSVPKSDTPDKNKIPEEYYKFEWNFTIQSSPMPSAFRKFIPTWKSYCLYTTKDIDEKFCHWVNMTFIMDDNPNMTDEEFMKDVKMSFVDSETNEIKKTISVKDEFENIKNKDI